jgi:hypothetical protein
MIKELDDAILPKGKFDDEKPLWVGAVLKTSLCGSFIQYQFIEAEECVVGRGGGTATAFGTTLPLRAHTKTNIHPKTDHPKKRLTKKIKAALRWRRVAAMMQGMK